MNPMFVTFKTTPKHGWRESQSLDSNHTLKLAKKQTNISQASTIIEFVPNDGKRQNYQKHNKIIKTHAQKIR
jgi:hypothetical protein